VNALSSIATTARTFRKLGRHRCRTFHGVLAGVLVAFLPGLARAQDANPVESQVKAAFLVKFPLFVEWPAGTFTNALAPIVVGVVGQDPFGLGLDEAIRKAHVEGRPLVLKRFQDVSALGSCHLLFISASEQGRLGEILRRLEDTPVLTVGDFDRFAHGGGIINFIKEAGKVRFEINLDAAKKAGLKLSPKLVQVSKVVGASG
jgi:hypothetical protein